MAHGPAALPVTGIDDFVIAAIQQYRAKLLDLSSRNPLVNFRHSDRSRSHIRVSDEIPEKLFERLESSRQLWFDPLPDPLLIPADEELPLFQEARRKARKRLRNWVRLHRNENDKKWRESCAIESEPNSD